MNKEVEKYIQGFPKESQKMLLQIRKLVLKAVPDAEEGFSYALPTFKWKKKPLLYYGAYAKHIACYPAPVGEPGFKSDFSKYKTGKGTVKFPLGQPLPLDLIHKIVGYRKELISSTEKKPTLCTCKKGHQYSKSSDCPQCEKGA